MFLFTKLPLAEQLANNGKHKCDGFSFGTSSSPNLTQFKLARIDHFVLFI
jgi:hypothetical protein